MPRPAAFCLTILALSAACRAAVDQTGDAPPEEGPQWDPSCRAAVDQQISEMQQLDQQQNATQLLFLGDSITEVWRGTVCGIPCHPALQLQCDAFSGLMQRFFGQYNPVVQAVAGDQVEHLMWRLRNGALPVKHQPRVVVLLIGINDLSKLGHEAPGNAPRDRKLLKVAPEVANRVQAAVQLLQERLPESQIVVLGLLPCGIWGLPGQANYKWPSPYAKASAAVNTRLRAYAASQTHVHFLDCGWRFLNANRTAIDAALLPDSLHPSVTGMERGIAQCIKPLVDLLMQL